MSKMRLCVCVPLCVIIFSNDHEHNTHVQTLTHTRDFWCMRAEFIGKAAGRVDDFVPPQHQRPMPLGRTQLIAKTQKQDQRGRRVGQIKTLCCGDEQSSRDQ